MLYYLGHWNWLHTSGVNFPSIFNYLIIMSLFLTPFLCNRTSKIIKKDNNIKLGYVFQIITTSHIIISLLKKYLKLNIEHHENIKEISISQLQVYLYNAEKKKKNTWRLKTILLSTTRLNDNYYTLKYDTTRLSASGFLNSFCLTVSVWLWGI